jgi:hypothetical protein
MSKNLVHQVDLTDKAVGQGSPGEYVELAYKIQGDTFVIHVHTYKFSYNPRYNHTLKPCTFPGSL